MNIIEKLIEDYGSQAKLARILGVTPQAITFYRAKEGLSPDRAVFLERETKGKYKAVKTCWAELKAA